jgi:hypothetical protein
MNMRPHRIIGKFRDRLGREISPPGEWTPPTQEVANRLITAMCLCAPAPEAVHAQSEILVSADPAAVAAPESDTIADVPCDGPVGDGPAIVAGMGRGRRGTKRRG